MTCKLGEDCQLCHPRRAVTPPPVPDVAGRDIARARTCRALCAPSAVSGAASEEPAGASVYLAGPMTGYPSYNFPAFHAAAAELRAQGYRVWNPAEQDEQLDGFDSANDVAQPFVHYMRRDLPAVMDVDEVRVLPGWEKSKGAQLEVHVARQCGIPVRTVSGEDVPVAETVLQEAQRLIYGARRDAYAHPLDDYTCTGRLWGALLASAGWTPPPGRAFEIPAELAALMMVQVKVSRESRNHKRDNLTDAAGYAGCVQEIHDERARRR